MDKIFTCPMCKVSGIDNFEFYQEELKTTYKDITKDGKISKRISRIQEDVSTMPWGLHCKSCGEWLDYCTDETGKIIEIKFK